MQLKLLQAKLHRATVTMTDPDYHGSITIDATILKAAGLLPNQAVTVADCDNGNRFETYIIAGAEGSRIIGINGAAARLTRVGHRVIVMAFGYFAPDEVAGHHAKILLLDPRNRIMETISQKTAL